jgi:hypothetical protein
VVDYDSTQAIGTGGETMPVDPGQIVDLDYQGPPVKPWYAAWLWAAVMTDRAGVPPPRDAASWDRETTWERILIARAIGIGARDVYHLTADPMTKVNPAEFGPIPLAWLHTYLSTELQAMIDFTAARGYGPLPGEPGSIKYDQMERISTASGLTIGDVHRDQTAAQTRVIASVDQWQTAQQAAAGIVLHAVDSIADDLNDTPRLNALTDWVNDYLAAHPDPFPNPLK